MILKTQYGYVADCGAMTAVAYSFGVTRRATLITWVSEPIQNYLTQLMSFFTDKLRPMHFAFLHVHHTLLFFRGIYKHGD